MLAIEESQKLTLSNLSSLSLFTGTDQGQFEVMKSQVLNRLVMILLTSTLPTLI